MIQRDLDSGDFIVHVRARLTHAIAPDDADKTLNIHYPFKALGGIGLVKEAETAHNLTHQAEHGHSHERAGHDKSMELSR
ncbi:hypothetical protein WJ973_25410 [Achromobacter xylosoxidans]